MLNVLLIGALDFPNVPMAGDAVKNRLLLDWLRQNFGKVGYVDTQKWRKNPFVLMKLFFCLLFCRMGNIIVSASNESAYRMIRILARLDKKGTNVYYFMIGGYTPIKIRQGIFKAEPFRKLERIVVEADKVKDYYAEVGLYNTYRVYNFKSTSYRADVSKPHEGRFKFVFLSRLTELKGIFHILESVRTLNEEGWEDGFEVDFYGRIDEDVKERFVREIAIIPNASYKGFLDLGKDSNYDVLASYDVMLFPTMHPTEGFPGVIADAAIAGLPVIAANWNYAEELVGDCKCGFVFPVGDNRALTDWMRHAMNHRDELQEIRKNCLSRSDSYRTDHVLTTALVRELGMRP
jgi:glycosyltransferase involved in cell wall biosynthesis